MVVVQGKRGRREGREPGPSPAHIDGGRQLQTTASPGAGHNEINIFPKGAGAVEVSGG